MTANSEPHNIVVTHTPMDATGARISGSIVGNDIGLNDIREILDNTEVLLGQTDKALEDPALNELAQAVRGSILAIEKLAFHLRDLHAGIAKGNVNYPQSQEEAFMN